MGSSALVLSVLLAMIVAACGAGTPPGDAPFQPGSPTSAADGAAGECQHGPVCGPGLIPEVAAVPLPASADEFSGGEANPNDPRGSARQRVFFDAPPTDIVAFYEAALPEAGFEIVLIDGGEEFGGWNFEVVTPDGHEGELHVRSAFTHGAQMSIELYIYR